MSSSDINKKRFPLIAAFFVSAACAFVVFILFGVLFPLNFVFSDHRVSCSPAEWEKDRCTFIFVYFDAGDAGLKECQYRLRNVDSGFSNGWLNAQPLGLNTCSGDATTLNGPITVGATGNCRDQGSQKCIIDWRALDNAAPGNERIELDIQRLSIDYISPTVGLVSPTSVVTNIATTLSAAVSDATSDINVCDLYINGAFVANMILSGTPVTSASVVHTFTTTGSYQVHALCNDKAGNAGTGSDAAVNVADPTLTFPSGTWQRLWYATSGVSPAFSAGNFLGEDFTQTLVMFNKDYTNGVLPDGGQPYARPDNIGFTSSRTIYFPFTDLFRFTLTSDDGVRLWIDDPLRNFPPAINEWHDKGGGSGIYTVDRSMSAGNHKFQLDYYENTGNAKVSFDYGASPTTCPAPKPLSFNATATSITVSWSPVLGAESYRVLRCTSAVGSCQSSSELGFLEQAGTIAPTTSYTFENLTPGETYSFNVRVQTDNNTVCNAAGEWTNVFRATTNSCLKTASLPPDAISVTVPTAEGTKQCTVSITHAGQDLSDNSGVKYQRLTPAGSPATIEMDDDPVGGGGCDLDLKFTNEWTPGNGSLSVKSTKNEYDASNNLAYGYRLSAASCVFQSFSRQSCALDGGTAPNLTCDTPSISADKRSVVSTQYWSPGYFFPWKVDSAQYQYTVVECTINSHCTVDPNKARCSTQNTCVDSVPPSSKITKVEDLPGKLPGFAPNVPTTGAYSAFLKGDNKGDTEKTWSLYVEDTDNSGGSDLDSCFMSINGLVLPRVCNGWAFFNVGKPATGAHCAKEGNNECKIKVWAQDKAGNKNDALVLERKVYEETLSAPRLDEQQYNNFIAYPDGFNVFWFGVDWTPPTAQ